jgi:uncharacterized protein RhaS with RHS repeats
MKAKTNAFLITVALLAFWVGLCNASAFYDPGTQRWLNRDPIGELGGLNLYGFVSNDPLDRLDLFGESDAPKDQPPITKPPISSENPFKPGRDNCLCYALNRPGGDLQPDGGYGGDNGKNCKDLVKQLTDKKHFPGNSAVPKSGNCPPGSHKISVFSDPNGGYHVQRQDSDGGWSEMGLNNPETYPPRKCKRGSSGNDCGNLCALD